MTDTSKPLKPLHQMILLLLAEEPTYGIRLMERLEARSNGTMSVNAGSLYRTLATLVDEGLVFGGETLTATDIAVASGHAAIGEDNRIK